MTGAERIIEHYAVRDGGDSVRIPRTNVVTVDAGQIMYTDEQSSVTVRPRGSLQLRRKQFEREFG